MSVDYTLYLVTGPYEAAASDRYYKKINEALRGGITLLQLREKKASSKLMYQIARKLKKMADACHVPLLINDRADVALAAEADGVHVGQDDLPAKRVRELIGREKLLGVSAATVEEAVQAERDGADYLGVGALFPTQSKDDAQTISMDTLRAIRRAVDLPIVVIGGINASTIETIDGAYADGAAVISAILAQDDVLSATRKLKEKANRFH